MINFFQAAGRPLHCMRARRVILVNYNLFRKNLGGGLFEPLAHFFLLHGEFYSAHQL